MSQPCGESGDLRHFLRRRVHSDRANLDAQIEMAITPESGIDLRPTRPTRTRSGVSRLAAPRPMMVISDGADWTQHVPENEFPFLQKIYGYYGATKK